MSVGKFVRTGAAAIGALFMAGAAEAADLYYGNGYAEPRPPATAPLWTGFYAGAHMGGDWSAIDAAGNVVFVLPDATIQPKQTVSGNGLFGGIQLGYNFQPGMFLWGIEADFGGMDIGGKDTIILGNPPHALTVSGTGGFYGDITARGGFAYGAALLYAKGGLALFTGSVTVAGRADGIYQKSDTFTGWTIGGGLEYMINPNWTVKGEYLYFDLGNNGCCFTSPGHFDNAISASTFKVGVNFLLDYQVPPLY